MNPQEHALEIALLRLLCMSTPSTQRMFGSLTVQSYGSIIKKACKKLFLPLYSAHSARAGFVTDAVLRGMSYADIMQVTRHQHLKSLIAYCDTVSSVTQAHNGNLKLWAQVALAIQRQPAAFFPQLSPRVVNVVTYFFQTQGLCLDISPYQDEFCRKQV